MLSFLKKHKIALIIAVVLVILVTLGLRARAKNGYETFAVTRDDLIRTVNIAGKVVPQDDADLSFEVGGTVSRAYKKVGDKVRSGEVIAELDSSATRADLLKAEADLLGAKAELAKLQGGNSLQAKVTNSKTSVVQKILDGYTAADDAVYNKVDQFFKDPRSANPEIIFSFDDYALRNKIDQARVTMGTLLSEWKAYNVNMTDSTYTSEDLDRAKLALRQVSVFLDDVAKAVNSFKTSTALTQTQIDKYKADVAAARDSVNAASAALITGEDTLNSAASDVPVQAARVAAAEATVENFRSKLGKMILRSPLDGIVSKQDAKVGEAISANTNIASVISSGLKIEAYVPEVSVAGLNEGATATVTLDAYGKDVSFKAKITHLDPRETLRDGVSTYKIELAFDTPDERVRPGMTSNLVIETERKPDVVLIPSRAVTNKGSDKYVLIKKGDKDKEERKIEAGASDSQGNIEVVSGVNEGEILLLDPIKK